MTTPQPPLLQGCGTALVTPFLSDGSLDRRAVAALARRQIEAGVRFLVPGGTTGEGVTLTLEEKIATVALTIEAAGGSVPIVAGCGGNNTTEVCELARELAGVGADALLTVTPYYNKPTPDGLYRHFSEVARAGHLPVVVYNVPGRTGVNVAPRILRKLRQIPNVFAVKEASGDIAQIGRICADAGEGFTVLAGDDASALPTIALGGRGVISVAGNLIPGPMAELCILSLEGDFGRARQLHRRWLPLMEALFVESNPGPVKFLLAEMGLLEANYRLPMTGIAAENRDRLLGVARETGLV